MKKPTFGWIVHTQPKAGMTVDALLKNNQRFLEGLSGDFDTLWFDDHLQKGGIPLLESWTTLSYLAARYPQYRIGSLVLCQSYRNPGLLAKMTATLQVISGGRYIAGIGAGWKQDEYEAYGYHFPPPGERVAQLDEVVQILRLMWSTSPATFNGKHYTILNADCEPLPETPPQLLIGGGGEKVTLRIVAKYADWMNLTFVDPPTYQHKLSVLKERCDEVGRDYNSIVKSVWAYVYVSNDGAEPAPDHDNRFQIYGTPAQVVDILGAYIDLGAEHFMLRFIDYPSPAGMELFLEKVLPQLA